MYIHERPTAARNAPDRELVGSLAAVPELRSRGLLRQLAQQACHFAFSRDGAEISVVSPAALRAFSMAGQARIGCLSELLGVVGHFGSDVLQQGIHALFRPVLELALRGDRGLEECIDIHWTGLVFKQVTIGRVTAKAHTPCLRKTHVFSPTNCRSTVGGLCSRALRRSAR